MATTIERKESPVQVQKDFLPPHVRYWHYTGIALVGAVILFLTYLNFRSVFQAAPAAEQEAEKQVKLPGYDLSDWKKQPVQDKGRYKPFETAAQELCREIHGRNKVLGHDPVAVVLSWMLEGNPKAVKRTCQWDDIDFILCSHEDIRRMIFLLQKDGTFKPDNLKHEQVHAKYISPNRLKEFREIYMYLEKVNPARITEITSDLPKNDFQEVFHRLRLYEAIRTPPPIGSRMQDPFAFVALDDAPGAPWFTIAELREIRQDADNWYALMKERAKDFPQMYLTSEHQEELSDFQSQIKAGQGMQAIDELKSVLQQRREQKTAEYLALREMKKEEAAAELIARDVATWPFHRNAEEGSAEKKKNVKLAEHLVNIVNTKEDEVIGYLGRFIETANPKLLAHAFVKADGPPSRVAAAYKSFLVDRDQELLQSLQDQLPDPSTYVPAKQQFRMLHLTYLETRFPDMYTEMWKETSPPEEEIEEVLASYDALVSAYNSGDAERFSQASQNFFATVEQTSESVTNRNYPGEDTVGSRLGHLLSGESVRPPSMQLIDLELTFNRVKPFMWAWVLMLLALLMFCLSLGLNNRIFYIVGFSAYAISLAFQCFGFFTRIIISGRPPVTNMYETVIWVAFMSGIFALILEAIYRKKVIALAGALVATIGLVLADQLPLALDPKINPLVPVLRSNFWLTIHVLTIVSSYAGGTLAWGLGNIALIMIVFGATDRSTIKMLSNFTYRALQIAVLLLAAGTFLGGWWAAYSWGRFWGWDPKETGALIALVCYVIPLHMRYIGWIKDFGLAVSAILCYAAILISWYGVNFVFPAGLHSYGFGGGGASWVYWAAMINIEWVLVASLIYRYRLSQPTPSQ